jgi:hypothetical protein
MDTAESTIEIQSISPREALRIDHLSKIIDLEVCFRIVIPEGEPWRLNVRASGNTFDDAVVAACGRITVTLEGLAKTARETFNKLGARTQKPS